MSTATLERRVSGVLTNATTVTLGIVRDSDSAVILAAGTAATHPSTGVYTYDYTALNLDPALSYTITWTATTGTLVEVITQTIPTTDDSYTLRGYRRALFRSGKLGRWDLQTTTSASTSLTATRELICSNLIDAERPTSAFDGCWVYLSTGALAGAQRRIVSTGYTGATGTLLTAQAFAGTVQSGVDFEIVHRLPITTADGCPGVHELINRALSMFSVPDRLSFTGVANQYHYPITQYPWLRSKDQIGPLYAKLNNSLDNPVRQPGEARLRIDAELPMLEIAQAFATGDTFYLDVSRPGNTWVKTGGAWQESTTGLVDDTDEALIDPRLVVEATLAFAWELLAEIGAPDERSAWAEKAKAQHVKAARLRTDLQEMLEESGRGTTNRKVGWGASGGAGTLLTTRRRGGWF